MATRTIRCATGPLDATVEVPGSKSIANRALVCAALAGGTSTLDNVPPGDDTVAMLSCLDLLGVGITHSEGTHVKVSGRHPSDWTSAQPALVLPTGLAGTTSRFLTALAALGDQPITIDGDPPLRRRPMAPLHRALIHLGVHLDAERAGQLPVTVCGPTTGSQVDLPGDVSSQFVTALMLVAPLLPDGLEIRLTSPLVSRPYVELTADVMAAFGAGAVEITADRVVVAPGAYVAVEYTIEPDASSAGYPLAAAAIVGGRVLVPGLSTSSVQADVVLVELLSRMGVEVRQNAKGTEVYHDGGRLRALGEVDLADASDLVPTVAVLAAIVEGSTRIRGVGFVRGKESDRIGDLALELGRLGVRTEQHDDGIEVHGSGHMVGAAVDTHHDHRLAMALALLGLRVSGVVVRDPDVVTKSWPSYWHMLDGLTR